uniref:Uncharacterized protein n=1 Tax=Manihot esculenta TaxID=3983 RepID=A0A2C9VZ00_MANES
MTGNATASTRSHSFRLSLCKECYTQDGPAFTDCSNYSAQIIIF